MAVNVSEAKEQMAYGKAKAIATWYLTQVKGEDAAEQRSVLDLTLEEAWEAKVAEDAEKALKRKMKEKKRKEDETNDGEGPQPEQEKPRLKHLRTSAEERTHWEERKEAREQKAAEKAAVKGLAKDGGKGKVGKSKEAVVKAVRSMSLRLYPSEALEKGLLGWIDIADMMDAHVKEVVETFAARGEKISFEYARNEYVCLTREKLKKMEKEGRLDDLKDLERRKNYLDVPYDVQQSTIKETVGNAKSAQSNYERGHNHGYEVGERDGSRRWNLSTSLHPECMLTRAAGKSTSTPKATLSRTVGIAGSI
jgi:hypothetical protein